MCKTVFSILADLLFILNAVLDIRSDGAGFLNIAVLLAAGLALTLEIVEVTRRGR